SMQVDDPERGFSYRRDGAPDMRMDRSRGGAAAQIISTIFQAKLARAPLHLCDEAPAGRNSMSGFLARRPGPLTRTGDLARIIMEATGTEKSGDWRLHPKRNRWETHPAARTFQALRMLVNRELANLEQLLRILPDSLRSGGRAAIISFHSGEDRLVKAA